MACLKGVGWTVKRGPEIAPGELVTECVDFGQVVLGQCLRDGMARLNPTFPPEVPDDAVPKLSCPEGLRHEARHRAVHQGVFSI